jgi:hypothetical protein
VFIFFLFSSIERTMVSLSIKLDVYHFSSYVKHAVRVVYQTSVVILLRLQFSLCTDANIFVD